MEDKLKLIQGESTKGSVVLVNPSANPIYTLDSGETSDGVYTLEDGLVHSIILDGFYLAGIRDKRQLSTDFRRRGRSIEIAVPVAYSVEEFEGIPFYVASFKGAGAIPEDGSMKNYVIDPVNWRSNGFGEVRQFGRTWGGLDSGFARGEAENDVLSSRGILHTPYVAQNQIPLNVQREIYRRGSRERQPSDPDLYQIVRLSVTNIRYDEFMGFNDEELEVFVELSRQAGWTSEEWAKHLGSVDGILVTESLKLEKQNQFFNFVPKGLMYDNRYISGEITDLEQVTISRYGEEMNFWPWPMDVMCQSKDFLRKVARASRENPQEVIDQYFDRISQVTGFKFTGGFKGEENEHMHQNHVSEYSKYRSKLRK